MKAGGATGEREKGEAVSLWLSAMHTYICTLLLFEFNDTITLMDMDIDYSFYASVNAAICHCCCCCSSSSHLVASRLVSDNDNFDYIDASFYEPQWY